MQVGAAGFSDPRSNTKPHTGIHRHQTGSRRFVQTAQREAWFWRPSVIRTSFTTSSFQTASRQKDHVQRHLWHCTSSSIYYGTRVITQEYYHCAFIATPYSPDLVPAAYHLYPKTKAFLKGHGIQSAEEAKHVTTETIKEAVGNWQQESFRQCYGRCHKCVIAEWKHFEGDVQ
jgi:hypothetical protein